MTCDHMQRDSLDAWVEGRMTTDADRRLVEAHVDACPECGRYVESFRAYRERLGAYGTATTPESLPAGFWSALERRLAEADGLRSDAGSAATAARRRVRYPVRTAIVLALLVLVLLAALARLLGPGPEIPIPTLLSRAGETLIPRDRPTFPSADADAAAAWLSGELGVRVPAVNLALAGARMVETRADRGTGRAEMSYRTADGRPVRLHFYLDSRTPLPRMRRVQYQGAGYEVAEDLGTGRSIALWQFDGRTYVAAGALPLDRLLPYAREMDRHCRRRP